MTALLEPGFDDIIFDPACGTDGFLFDAFEFVMQHYLNDKAWPGEKGHSELKKWFSGYFKNNPIEMPTDAQTKQFYRSGVSGIEYLGMIRKMAAINFYIRSLNPANIVQGDSLAKYNPVTDHESKSIVLANPPFGTICDLNFVGADMLGEKRFSLINSNFKLFVSEDSKPVFNNFFRKVCKSNAKESCEVKLGYDNKPLCFVYMEGVITEDEQKCLLSVIDISKFKLQNNS